MPTILLQVLFLLLVTGLFLRAVRSLPWIDNDIKQIIRILVVVLVGIYLLYVIFGLFGGVSLYPVHHRHL